MKSMRNIVITYEGRKLSLPRGTTVRDAFSAFGLKEDLDLDYQKNPIVSALVNGAHAPLSERLVYTSTISPVKLFSSLGKRCYRQSISYLLAAVCQKLYPRRVLMVRYALGDGYYFTFDDEKPITIATIRRITAEMRRFVARRRPISKNVISLSQAVDWFDKNNMCQTRDLLKSTNEPLVEVYELGGYIDTAYDPIVDNTALLSVWELRKLKLNGMLLRYPRSFDFTKLDTYKENRLLFQALQKDREQRPILKVNSISELSEISHSPQKLAEYIRLCEAYQAKHIADIADMIDRRKGLQFVFISGPSSSGKTTFAYKMCTQLQVRGHETVELSLDNYYLNPDQVPKDEEGKPDFERLDALDLPLLQQNLSDLHKGKAVRLPIYSFKKHERSFGEPVSLGDGKILVIEGIHGMNPALTGAMDRSSFFRIYISAFTQVNISDHNRISTTDNRVVRRIVRDWRTRGSDAVETLSMIPSVQRGENLYIFPYQNNADAMINSALDYELAVLAPLAVPLLRAVGPESGDIYHEARRLLSFLDNFQPIPLTAVPSSSLLREFIGGSEYGVV